MDKHDDVKLEEIRKHVEACTICTAADKRVNDFCEAGQLLFFEWAIDHEPTRVEEVGITPEQYERLLAHARRRLRAAGRN
jgi:hypothetical protein